MSRGSVRAQLVQGLDVLDLAVQGPHGAIPLRRYAPVDAAPDADALLWVHGGGFVSGDLDQLESHAVAAALARAGRVVFGIDYRKVPLWNLLRAPHPGRLPGIRYPVPLDDVLAAFDHVRSESPTGAAFLGGASAGGNLTAAAALRLRDEDRPSPLGLILAYGDLHATLPPRPPELVEKTSGFARFTGLSPSTITKMNWNYAGSLEARADAYAFPGGHDLHGLPPVLAIDADRDNLRASGGAFARELRAAGLQVDYEVVSDVGHGFLNKPGTRAFDEGVTLITAWLTARSVGDDSQLDAH